MGQAQASGERGVAAASAAVAGFFAAAVLPRGAEPLVDPDVWWHIRAGSEVLDSGVIPRADRWSLVAFGEPWTSQDWLANVLLAAGHRLGPWGDTVLSLLFGTLTVVAFWVLWLAMKERVPAIGWASRVIWLSVGLALAGPVLGVRVQVFDLLLAAAVVWALWRYSVDPRRRWLVMLPLLAVAWANLHAGWVLLFLFGGATICGEAIDRLANRRPAGTSPLRWASLGELGLALVASALAVLLNPNGLDLWRYPFETAAITALGDYVLEWAPASLANLFGWMTLGFVVAAVVPALVLGRRHLRTADALILVGLTIMAWRAIRFLLILGPIGAAIVGIALAPAIWRSPAGRTVSPVLQRLARPRRGLLGGVNAALVVLVVGLGIGVATARVGPKGQETAIAAEMPVAAVRWMDATEPGERVFNRYEWGGYIGQHRPQKPIFMDGRADVYGDDLLHMYVDVIGLNGDPQVVMDRYEIDHAILPPDWPLAAWFDGSPSWQRVYADGTAVIWVRR